MGDGASLISRVDPIHLQVYNYIRQGIASGELPPGERLVEAQMAARLGVSRAPVREALRKLEQDGLVRSVMGKGSVVHRFTLQDIRNVYACRAALEGMAAQLCAARPEPELLARLEATLERTAAAVAAGAADEVLDLTNQWHDLLLEQAGNGLLTELLHGLRDRILIYRKLAIREVPVTTAVSQAAHRQIVEAIRRGDGPAANAAAQAVLVRVCDHLALYLKEHGLVAE